MHDLCLAIGGMTVTEMKERMPAEERQGWIAYIRKNGPVNPMIRIDAAVARAVLPFMKKGTSMSALMPWPDPDKQIITLEAAMKEWR